MATLHNVHSSNFNCCLCLQDNVLEFTRPMDSVSSLPEGDWAESVYMYICIYVCMCIYMCVCVHVCVCVYIYIYIYICMYLRVCVYVCVCT